MSREKSSSEQVWKKRPDALGCRRAAGGIKGKLQVSIPLSKKFELTPMSSGVREMNGRKQREVQTFPGQSEGARTDLVGSPEAGCDIAAFICSQTDPVNDATFSVLSAREEELGSRGFGFASFCSVNNLPPHRLTTAHDIDELL